MADRLLQELKKAYGENAEFREGQREAIQNLLDGRRCLVVQKTGWGKSLIYFLAAKLLREDGRGMTLIISPLLALMNNQVDAAEKLGLRVETIHSDNQENHDDIYKALEENKLDALIISPERLANEEFQKLWRDGNLPIGAFVVDEAHCISDWGHDFRPDYRRIIDLIHNLPRNVPVLATTATANMRVVEDIRDQLGNDLVVSRGSLMRRSLALQVIKLPHREDRLAWLADHIPELPGTGLIYCLTVADCQMVNQWLQEIGIPSRPFYSTVHRHQPESKETIIDLFMHNQIKVLVATVAFGMGFDKPDIGFVIHFQRQANLVGYYQQIGRAGRAIDYAPAILLCGEEDDEINHYFINSAFPPQSLINDVMRQVRSAQDGITMYGLFAKIDANDKAIKQCLQYLLVEKAVNKEPAYKDAAGNRIPTKYYPTAVHWRPDLEKQQRITRIREGELAQVNNFINSDGCLMQYIAEVLDAPDASGPNARPCGRCANCLGHPLISEKIRADSIQRVGSFLRNSFQLIEPRKKWPDSRDIPQNQLCQPGRVLCNYGTHGLGRLVKDGKYVAGFFDDQLVEASAELLEEYIRENNIQWVTNIPSIRRPQLVADFAQRLAARLGLQYMPAVEKTQDSRPQKELNNSSHQYRNADESFGIVRGAANQAFFAQNLLLVDDMVDSKWTFTVCGSKLRAEGSGEVFPFALANTANRSGEG